VQEDDASLGPVTLRCALQHADEPHEGNVEAIDGVAPTVLIVLEEVVANQPLLVVDVLLLPVRQDHVVDALEGIAGDGGVLLDDGQVIFERTRPVQLGVLLQILQPGDLPDHVADHVAGHVPDQRGRITSLACDGIGQGHRHYSLPESMRGGGPANQSDDLVSF
jgi:hypothetical protein